MISYLYRHVSWQQSLYVYAPALRKAPQQDTPEITGDLIDVGLNLIRHVHESRICHHLLVAIQECGVDQPWRGLSESCDDRVVTASKPEESSGHLLGDAGSSG